MSRILVSYIATFFSGYQIVITRVRVFVCIFRQVQATTGHPRYGGRLWWSKLESFLAVDQVVEGRKMGLWLILVFSGFVVSTPWFPAK